MLSKLTKFHNQKATLIGLKFVIKALATKTFSSLTFLLFYSLILHPMTIKDINFNASFFELLYLFIFMPKGHFSMYIFFIIFLVFGFISSHFLFKNSDLINSYKFNKNVIGLFRKLRKLHLKT